MDLYSFLSTRLVRACKYIIEQKEEYDNKKAEATAVSTRAVLRGR